MNKEKRVAVPFDGAGIEETRELAIPKEPADAGNMRSIENDLFGLQVVLLIQAIQLRQDQDHGQNHSYEPLPPEKLLPVPLYDQMPADGPSYRDNGKHPFGHDGTGRKNTAC